MPHTIRFVTALLLALGAAPLAAQDLGETLVAGDRVRIRHDGFMVEGRLVALDDSLRLDTPHGALVLPFPQGSTLERQVRRSRGSGLARGAGYGLLAGAISGGLAGFAMGDDPPGFMAFTAAEKGLMLGTVFGVGAAVIGGVVGLAAPGHSWERLGPGGLRASIYPVSGGAGVSIVVALP